MSSETEGFVYREHAKTNVSALCTTDSEIIKTYSVKKGKTLSPLQKKLEFVYGTNSVWYNNKQ